MEEAGLLTVPVEIVLGPDHYLLGEETGLLEAVEERLPLPRMARPYVLGLHAQPPNENPTLVNNVETLSNVPLILEHGSAWFRQSGTGDSGATAGPPRRTSLSPCSFVSNSCPMRGHRGAHPISSRTTLTQLDR